MANETSAKVKVYPCAYRGQVLVGTTNYLYNPESRLPTEHNITEAVNNVSTVNNGSYIISPAAGTTVANDTKLIFVIHGYRFEVDNIATVLADATIAAGTNIYALIQLNNRNTTFRTDNTDYEGTSLNKYGGTISDALDVGGSFMGLAFDSAAATGTNQYSLLIASRASTSADWKTPSSSYLRLDATNIADVDQSGVVQTTNIHETFHTGTLNTTGAVTIGGTTASAGKLTVGAGGAEITGDTTIHTGDLTLDGSMKQIKVGSTVVANNMIEVAGTMGQGYVQADKINGDQLYPKTAGGDITVNTNLKINLGKKLNVNTIEKTSGTAINITSPMEAGNISTTGLTATSDANIGTSGTPFNNIYGTTLHGTLNLTYTLKAPDANGEITGLTSGWYAVKMIRNLGEAGMFFPVYVPDTNSDGATYYSPSADLIEFQNSGSSITAAYNQYKICAEATSASTGKISFGSSVLAATSSGVKCAYVKQNQAALLENYTIYVARISN